ncbi:hypothetical protein KSP39_PZI013818 [Platanthera zijinensis]|uniref:Uncharacterized protein n=1 Tax=Platanthera zijinensis TaxID=2320716 RepID=A0AAP0BEY4_9ASPA
MNFDSVSYSSFALFCYFIYFLMCDINLGFSLYSCTTIHQASMSITSQLQVIKSLSKGKEDQIHRPLTRPSVLFGPKEAADIDLISIFPLAQSGNHPLSHRFLPSRITKKIDILKLYFRSGCSYRGG